MYDLLNAIEKSRTIANKMRNHPGNSIDREAKLLATIDTLDQLIIDLQRAEPRKDNSRTETTNL